MSIKYPTAYQWALPQVPLVVESGMSTLTFMTAAALPGALAAGAAPTIAARMAFEAASRACELIDKVEDKGGNPLDVLGAR